MHWFDSWAGIENMKTDAAPATVGLAAGHSAHHGPLWICLGIVYRRLELGCRRRFTAPGSPLHPHVYAITGWYPAFLASHISRLPEPVNLPLRCWARRAQTRSPLVGHYHQHHHIYSDKPETRIRSARRIPLGPYRLDQLEEIFPPRLKSIGDFAKFPRTALSGSLRHAGAHHLRIRHVRTGEAAGSLCTGTRHEWSANVDLGFFVSTVALLHGTCTINSLSHVYGSQRYKTGTTARTTSSLP